MVLFDGDWYFCLRTNHNSNQTGMACKTKWTYEEERMKDSYKTDSLDIGLGLCCIVLPFWISVEYVKPRIITCCNCNQCQNHYFEQKYEKILAEEISICIEENLKEIAKSKAKEMCQPKIEVLKSNDLSQENVDVVSQAWGNISDPGFLLKYQRHETDEALAASCANESQSTEPENEQNQRH
ncbi:hypothetical protein FQA47_010551 [Oryzias melastigma]|uniref:Uncharacterized protein n=1 Tax=Oryzias melastigma TaxID=30732 RepID=A0A834CG15_ORYME|nr:hypothetical protein FQA47_010551 [Oryzias melastigma]